MNKSILTPKDPQPWVISVSYLLRSEPNKASGSLGIARKRGDMAVLRSI
jgi:hypothetical protein